MLTDREYERYSRQVALPEIGVKGQQKLLAAKVLVIGAGGLGCPVLQYLAATGVGCIGIVDDDTISLSNLHRQILFSTDDVGKQKAITAAQKLEKINPGVKINTYNTRLSNINSWEIINDYDVIIDGSDNFPTRYMVNDACVLLNKPLVHGSIYKFEGQVAVFNFNGSAHYRDIFATPPAMGEVPTCVESGVMGILPGIIGNLMANEATKIITGNGTLLTDRILTYHSLRNTFYEIEITRQDSNSVYIPTDKAAFEKMDYGLKCNTPTAGVEISIKEFSRLLGSGGAIVFDIREDGELPVANEFINERIHVQQLEEALQHMPEQTIVLFCQSGKRSQQAVKHVRQNHPERQNIFSLQGGIMRWKQERIKQNT